MKLNTKAISLIIFLSMIFASCQSSNDNNELEAEPETVVEAPVPEPEPVDEPAPVPQPEPEPEPIPEPEPEPEPQPEPEPIPEPEPEQSKEELEYQRSVKQVAVSRDTFESDKRQIVQNIEELNKIMTDRNFEEWKKYVAPDSITYWSSKQNLTKASKNLPKELNKLQLNTLKDYFNYVFIPSRKGHHVDEIRYLSETSVKAVQVKDDNSIVVYYNFVKENGKWLVDIPRM